MGWSDCGTDSNGRPIGYVFGATCDHEGCNRKIDRGLSRACGGMHGEGEWMCEKYFCAEHLSIVCDNDGKLDQAQLCPSCKEKWEDAHPCDECGECD
jgi:hypothetical protein